MGRDGTALLPSLCATILLRIYPAEAESEIKMISMFSLMTNHLQKHWEKEQVCWVLGFPATGSSSTWLEHNTAMAMLQAAWERSTALTCSLGVPRGTTPRPVLPLVPFQSARWSQRGEEHCARQAGSKAAC